MKTNLKLLLSAALVAGLMSAGTFATSCGSGGTGGSGGGSTGGGTGGGSTGGGTGGGTAGGSGGGTAGGTGGGTAGGSGGGTAGGTGGGTAGGTGGGTAGGTGGAGGGTAGGAGGGTAGGTGGAGGGTAGGTGGAGGAGGGGGAGGAGGGAAAATCAAYCNTISPADAGGCAANPDGGTTFQQYPDQASCLGACTAFPQGALGAQGGLNLECRSYHAGVAVTSVANKATHCPHAGPAGDGVCGSNCESFCTIAAAKCPNAFATPAACQTACAAYAGSSTARYNSSSASGNTYACHMYHLSVAATNASLAAVHCAHIVPGAGPCN